MTDISLSELLKASMRIDSNINQEVERKELNEALAKISAGGLSNLPAVIQLPAEQPVISVETTGLNVSDHVVIPTIDPVEPLAALYPEDEDEDETPPEDEEDGDHENGNQQGLESGDEEPLESSSEEDKPVTLSDEGQGGQAREEVTPAPVPNPWDDGSIASTPVPKAAPAKKAPKAPKAS